MRSASFPSDHPLLATSAIWHPDEAAAPRAGFAVVCFRRRFRLERPLRRGALWISASMRFELHLDGGMIARGPARGDPLRWHAARVELPEMSAGDHLLAVRVVHFDGHAGIGQLGGPAFLLVRGEGALSPLVDSGEGWRCLADRSREPHDRHAWPKRPYYVVGCGERLRCADAPWGWERPDHDDAAWREARVVASAVDDGWGNLPLGHLLRPDPLPAMAEEDAPFARVAEAPDQLRSGAQALIAGGALEIPAGTAARIVLDRGEPTNAYPALALSGGAGARVRMVWAESPYTGEGHAKGDRGVVAGKQLWGHLDEVEPDGGGDRVFAPLWFRSFRHLELTVETAGRPLRLESLRLRATGFPLRRIAQLRAGGDAGASWERLLDVSWRTLRLCAHETFFDCPHYEQAQFPGDSRIQALAHYLLADEQRLALKCIDDMHASRMADGMLQCRYPSRQVQILPTFALHWIGMLHDLVAYRGDAAAIAAYLPAAREALGWFLARRREDGLLAAIPHAPFVDWSPAFAKGNAPQDADGGSAILALLCAQACGWLADLEAVAGWRELAQRWRRERAALLRAVRGRCLDARRGLLADTPTRRSWSLHAQVEGVLAGLWSGRAAAAAMDRALADAALAQPGSHYYRFYVLRALQRCGRAGRFAEQLPRWTSCLDGTGLVTWPETDGPTPRSDCHAWSVAPAIAAVELVLGVTPAAPGFARLRFAPVPCGAPAAAGSVPTPHGIVRVRWERRADGRIDAELRTPVPALVAGRARPLAPGTHRLLLPPA